MSWNKHREVALVVLLEERGVPEALSDGGSAGREGRAYVMLGCFFIYTNIILSRPQTLGAQTLALGSAILFVGKRGTH
jgi:hypothetical protein